jgi:hypothetical protein
MRCRGTRAGGNAAQVKARCERNGAIVERVTILPAQMVDAIRACGLNFEDEPYGLIDTRAANVVACDAASHTAVPCFS